MALSTLAALLAAKASPTQNISTAKLGQLPTGTHWNSQWTVANPTGVAPTTGAVPTNTTVGAIGQVNKSAGEQRAWLRKFAIGYGGIASGGVVALVDRLSHMGGLSGTGAGAQTVNTAALTRSTAGADFAAVEIYTDIGATGSTYTCSYTSDVGAGKTSPVATIGGAGFLTAKTMLIMPLAAGDTLVKSVESLTLSGTTGTVGNFGVTLFKVLGMLPWTSALSYQHRGDPELGYPMPVIPDGACLDLIVMGVGNASSMIAHDICFFED